MNPVKSLAPLLLSLTSACASSADPHSDETGTADDVSGSDGGSEPASSENSSTVAGSDGSSGSGGASNGSTSGTGAPTRTTASSSGGTNTGTASSAGGSGGLEAIGGEGGSAGGDDSDDGTSAAGAAGDNDDDDPDDGELEPGRVEAMAITRARLEELREEEDSTSTGSVTGGDAPSDLDPNDLFLRFSDLGVMCTEAFSPLPCGSHWFVSIVLPPEYQAVGVYDLGDPAISSYSYRSETGEARQDSDDCSWGGGSLGGGTLEVLAIDDSEVRFQVTLFSGIWDTDPDGEYTAVRCD